MIYGSVCSGIEAATQAWHPLGWRASFFSEIDAFPRAVLSHHYPDVPLHGDFTTIEAGQYEPIDLLVGGTPCQSFSVAGLRGGLGDGRGNLALEYCRLAERLRPRWVVWENVPGVLSSGGGRDFGSILGGLGELGYGLAYRVLDAQYVRTRRFPFAVPQRRRRVFVVGHIGDWRRAAAVLALPEGMSGHPPPRREAGQGVARGFECGPSGGGFAAPVAGCLNAHFGDKMGLENQHINQGAPLFVAYAIQERAVSENAEAGPDGKGWNADGAAYTLEARHHVQATAHALRAEGFDASEDGTGRGTPIVPVAYDLRGRDGGAQMEGPHETANLRAASGGSSRSYVQERWSVRRLTPRECERLQGFPDDFTAVPYRGKPADQCPDGPRYKALGNSMAVNVMEWIGERIALVDVVT